MQGCTGKFHTKERTMPSLEKCPFCGTKPEFKAIQTICVNKVIQTRVGVSCSSSACIIYDKTNFYLGRNEAASRWNKRA
jgi:hypothetical protein